MASWCRGETSGICWRRTSTRSDCGATWRANQHKHHSVRPQNPTQNPWFLGDSKPERIISAPSPPTLAGSYLSAATRSPARRVAAATSGRRLQLLPATRKGEAATARREGAIGEQRLRGGDAGASRRTTRGFGSVRPSAIAGGWCVPFLICLPCSWGWNGMAFFSMLPWCLIGPLYFAGLWF